MSFGENLQQQKSHQALLHLQDAEVQLLESIKKCVDHRIKSDKQYANALTVIVNQAQKLDTSVSNPLFQVWNSIIRETEKWIDVLRQNTEKLSTKALERLIHLINEKKIARKSYLEEKLRIDGELNKLKDEVTKLKQEYEKNVIKQIQDRVRLEDLIAKGVPSKKIDDARLKLSKSAQKLHRTHNDYVTALLEATEHEKHYQNTILPNLLNYQEEIQKLTFSKCKSIIKNYAELTDFTKPDYTAIYRNIHYQVDTLSPVKEYEVFVRENKSERLTTVGLEFDGHLLTGYTGTLKENQLAVDTLTIEYVRQNYSKITDQLIECQQKITNIESKLTAKEDQLSKTPNNDQETNKYEVNKQAVLAIEKELSELRCKECILKELQKLYNQQLNKFRNRDPPVAVDLLENVPDQLTERKETDSPVTTSPDGSSSIQSKLNMVFHKLKKPTQVPPQLPEKDFMAEPAGGNESSLNPSGPALTNNLMPQSVGVMKSTPIPTLDSYQQVTVGQETSGLHQMTSYSSKNVDDEEWFHGVLPREEVQRLLVNDGDYLVRVSKNRKTGEAQYVLSVKWGDHKHFIIQEQDGTWRLETYQFQTIQDLIISQHTSGLPVTRKSGAILKNPIHRENWELKNDDISLGQKIGNGNFGDVFKGTYKPLNLEVAIKTCRETLSEDAKKKFLQEGRILKQYEHPNIVKFIGIAAQRHPVMIVMEYVAGGSLLNFLKKQGSVQSKKQLVKMCQDACAGMAYLENRNCIHRDLAARNCLVGKNNIVKISDFGMSREEEEYTVSGGLKQIPIKWTAPEALNYGVYTSACDVWSFGVLMWEVFSFGMSPYPGLTNSQAKEKVDDGYRMPRPDSMPEAVYSLTLLCWQKEPKDRPTFDTVNTELQRIHKSLR